jgi:hypothetical protein
MTARKIKSSPYKVGYGKPPRHTQFRRGRSGNPRGRPPRDPVRRLEALTLQEAYRAVAIKENGLMVPATTIQAILRSQAELAANGNVQAQRAILAAVQRFEEEKARDEAFDAMLQPLLAAAAIHLGISVDELRTGTCEHEPEPAEPDRAESIAADGTGGE